MGILIMQDILLGILMAVLPNMAESERDSDRSVSVYFLVAFRLLFGKLAQNKTDVFGRAMTTVATAVFSSFLKAENIWRIVCSFSLQVCWLWFLSASCSPSWSSSFCLTVWKRAVQKSLDLLGLLLPLWCCWSVETHLFRNKGYPSNLNSKVLICFDENSISFALWQVTEYLQLSMEVGCFLAGVMISAQDPALSGKVDRVTEPVRDFMSCIFFVSIGEYFFAKCFFPICMNCWIGNAFGESHSCLSINFRPHCSQPAERPLWVTLSLSFFRRRHRRNAASTLMSCLDSVDSRCFVA